MVEIKFGKEGKCVQINKNIFEEKYDTDMNKTNTTLRDLSLLSENITNEDF